jgi:murein DD-endopeptidase MepM/ murein hydrolase activator NlpD
VRPGPARVRRVIGRALLVAVLLAPAALALPAAAHAQSKPAKSAAPAKPATCTHTVRSGESLGRISARHRVPRATMTGANHLPNPDTLRPGQRLAIPGCRPPASTVADVGPVVLSGDGSVLRRVGPRRILTELVLAPPAFQEDGIALGWPVQGPVISIFGRRARDWHAGIDISAEAGSAVLAAAPGTVLYSGWIRAYGQIVKIQHSSGFITLYAHNSKNLVEEGDEVEIGQLIATVGRSGHATGPHLHSEVRRDGKAYDPLHVLDPSDQSPIFEGDVAASTSDVDPHE